jgi:hypothetical protein
MHAIATRMFSIYYSRVFRHGTWVSRCHFLGKVAVVRGLLRQAEDARRGGGFAEHAPPLHHLVPSEVEQAVVGWLRPRGELVAVGDGLEDLGGAQLRVLGDPDRVQLDELGHLLRDAPVLHQRPPAEHRHASAIAIPGRVLT